MKFYQSISLAGLLAFTNPALAETLTNDTIVTLAKAGLSEGLIIDKINSEACSYDVNTDKIISLKQSGLTDSIIGAMVRRCATLNQQRGIAGDDSSPDPTTKHSLGIFAFENWLTPNKVQIIRPSKPSGVKTTGIGSIVFPFVTKMVMAGSKSHIEIPTNSPDFYFYFNPSDEKVSDFGTENSAAAQSPDEFTLVKFAQKAQDRELNIGKTAFYGYAPVTHRQGIDSKYTIPVQAFEIAKGIFKVTSDKDLDAGEYAFLFTGLNGNSRVYDFSITKALVKLR